MHVEIDGIIQGFPLGRQRDGGSDGSGEIVLYVPNVPAQETITRTSGHCRLCNRFAVDDRFVFHGTAAVGVKGNTGVRGPLGGQDDRFGDGRREVKLHAVQEPCFKVVAALYRRRSRNIGGLAVFHFLRFHGTAAVGIKGDGVLIDIEVCLQGDGLGHESGEGKVCTVESPLVKGVADLGRIGGLGEGCGSAVFQRCRIVRRVIVQHVGDGEDLLGPVGNKSDGLGHGGAEVVLDTVQGPTDKVVTFLGGRAGSISQLAVLDAVLRQNCAAALGVKDDVVGVDGKLCFVVGRFACIEGKGSGGADLNAALCPLDEVIADVGRGNQGNLGAVVVVARTCDAAVSAGSGADGVNVDLADGTKLNITFHGESVRLIFADAVTALVKPTDEVVTVFRGSGQSCACTILIFAVALNGGMRSGNGDVIRVQSPLGSQSEGTGDVVVEVVFGPADVPACEGVTNARRHGGHFQFAVVEREHVFRRASVSRIDDDRILLGRELGSIVHVAFCSKAETAVAVDESLAVKPAEEVVAFQCGGGKSNRGAVVVVARARSLTAGLCGGGDVISLDFVERGDRNVLGCGEGVGGFRADGGAALLPADEFEAFVGRDDGKGDGRAVIIDACTLHHAVCGIDLHGVLIDGKACRVISRFGNGERIRLLGADERAALKPADEGVALVRSGYQGGSQAVLKRAAADGRTVLVGSDGDGVNFLFKDGDVLDVPFHGEGEGGVRADGSALFVGPLHKVVALVRSGNQSCGGVLVQRAAAGDGTALGGSGGNGNSEGVGLKSGFHVSVFGNRETVSRLVADLRAVHVPAVKGITRCGSCAQTSSLAALILALIIIFAFHRTACGGRSGKGDLEILLKHGGISRVLRCGNGKLFFRAHARAVLLPFLEVIAVGSSCAQRGFLACGKGAAARDGTAARGADRCGDVKRAANFTALNGEGGIFASDDLTVNAALDERCGKTDLGDAFPIADEVEVDANPSIIIETPIGIPVLIFGLKVVTDKMQGVNV